MRGACSTDARAVRADAGHLLDEHGGHMGARAGRLLHQRRGQMVARAGHMLDEHGGQMGARAERLLDQRRAQMGARAGHMPDQRRGTWGLGLHQAASRIGMQDLRKQLNKQTDGKAALTLDRYSRFFPDGPHVPISTEQIVASFRHSMIDQVAG